MYNSGMLPTCKGVVPDTYVACGESPEVYGYCSEECEREALEKIHEVEHRSRNREVGAGDSQRDLDYEDPDGVQ